MTKRTATIVLLAAAAAARGQSALSTATPPPMPATRPASQPTTRASGPIVILKSGERIVGPIVERTDDAVVVDSRLLGRVTLANDDVETILENARLDDARDVVAANTRRPSADDVAGAKGPAPVSPLSAAAPPPPGDPGLFDTGFLVGWARQFEFGFSGASGTADSLSVDAQLNASISNDVYRSTLGASYFYANADGTVGQNQTRAFATADRRLNGGPYFVFGRAQYDNDSLQVWENRVSVYGGPGYEFIKNDTYELLGRVGIGYTVEFGGNVPAGYDESRVEGLVGVDGKWRINDTSSFVFSIYYTPSLERFMDEGRVVTTLAYQADFATYRGLAFKTGLEHAYEFKTPGDDEHNDWKYFANLVFKL